jgi:DNA-binding transcriptional regulator YdaS (Cro superfamily)
METVKEIFGRYGVTRADCARRGISYQTVHSHWTGRRRVKPEQALRYEKLMGIPRWELRPDIWEPPHGKEESVPGQG